MSHTVPLSPADEAWLTAFRAEYRRRTKIDFVVDAGFELPEAFRFRTDASPDPVSAVLAVIEKYDLKDYSLAQW